MAMTPFAFSVHNFISSIGADAGFAAIIGLAVLVLLYFAHARETANLREEADLLTERLQRAEARVAQLSRAQAAPAPAAVPVADAPAALLAPFAPMGMAAPALASATRVVALPEPPEVEDVEEVEPEPVAAPMAVMAMAGVAAPPPRYPLPGPVPAPARAGAAPTDSSDPAVPAPATAAGGNGSGHPPAGPAPGSSEPGWSGQISVSRSGSSAARKLPPLGQLPPLEPQRRRSRIGRGVAIAVVALAAVAVAVVLFALTSVGSNKSTPGTSTSNAPGPAHARTAATFKPSSVTVAVLNGTATNQLAHRIGQKLAAQGYKEGTLATAANQTHTTTVVAYTDLANRHARAVNRTAALHVAEALGLRRSAVQPVDQSALQVACPAAGFCAANVVVTVGADLASQ
jgi:hypothetical protein